MNTALIYAARKIRGLRFRVLFMELCYAAVHAADRAQSFLAVTYPDPRPRMASITVHRSGGIISLHTFTDNKPEPLGKTCHRHHRSYLLPLNLAI